MMLESEMIKYWVERWYERLLNPEDDMPPVFPGIEGKSGS